MSIDEKALQAVEDAIYEYCYEAGFSASTIASKAITAYESAKQKQPSGEVLERVARAIGNSICLVHPDSPPSTQVSTKGEKNGWMKAAKAALAAMQGGE